MPRFNIIVPAATGPDYVVNDIIATDSREAQRSALASAKEAIKGFVKKGNCLVDEVNELVVIEATDISDMLVLPKDVPSDFYSNPIFAQQIEKAIKLSSKLKYNIDAEGEKSMKADVQAINKYATGLDKIAAAIYKSKTDTAQANRSLTKGYVKALNANSDAIKDQFTEAWANQLREIQDQLSQALRTLRSELGIEKEFCKAGNDALTPMVKLTGTRTESGALTKKARDFVNAIADSELKQQLVVTNRKLVIANKCMCADITPLSPEYLGSALYSTDDVFNSKLDALIAVEKQRTADAEKRAAEKEAAKVVKIENDLNRVAVTINNQPMTQQEIDKMRFDRAKALDDVRRPPVPQQSTEKRTVRVTLTFEIPDVSHRSSNEGVCKVYTDGVMKLLPESLQARFKGASAENV